MQILDLTRTKTARGAALGLYFGFPARYQLLEPCSGGSVGGVCLHLIPSQPVSCPRQPECARSGTGSSMRERDGVCILELTPPPPSFPGQDSFWNSIVLCEQPFYQHPNSYRGDRLHMTSGEIASHYITLKTSWILPPYHALRAFRVPSLLSSPLTLQGAVIILILQMGKLRL